MTGSDNLKKTIVDAEPEEERSVTSSTSSGRHVSWLHLCVIYGLLGIYGLWAATSYQLMRSSLLGELEASGRRGVVVSDGGLDLPGADSVRVFDRAAMRRRRSVEDSHESVGREARDTRQRRRRLRNRYHKRPSVQSRGGTEDDGRRRQTAGRESRRSSESLQIGTTIHMHARSDVPKQFRSNAMVSFNSSGDTTYRFWRKADWVSDSANQVFRLDEDTGHVVVKQAGVYLVYAQMVYHDLTGRWSFGVYVHGRQVVKCLSSEQLRDAGSLHQTSHGVYQQCNTATTIHLNRLQSLHVRCMYGSRTILTQPEFTFWGVVKLS